MTRDRKVTRFAWTFIFGIVIATHLQGVANRTSLNESVILLACGMISVRLTLRRVWGYWVHLYIGYFLVFFIAFLYGGWFEAHVPNHPIARLGQQDVIEAEITKVELRTTGDVIVMQVDKEGTPFQRCAFPSVWYTKSQTATHLSQGTKITLRGIFVADTSKNTPVQNWLNPLWSFRGSLLAVLQPTNSARVSSDIRQMLMATVPNTYHSRVDVALSMVIGRAAPVSTSVQNLFLEAGVTHLLAASGANVLIFCRAASFSFHLLFRRLGLKYRWFETMFLLLSISAFVFICGFSAPIVRAGLFAAYGFVASSSHRRVSARTSMSLVCLLFAICEPYQFTSVSALFSMTAAYAMNGALSTWQRHPHTERKMNVHSSKSMMRRLTQMLIAGGIHLLEVLYISLMIDVTMLPLVWWWFGQLTPYGAIGTVLAEPFVIVLLPMAIVWVCLAIIASLIQVPFVGCATLLGLCVVHMVSLLLGVLKHISALPGSLLTMPTLPFWLVAVYFFLFMIWQRVRIQSFFFRKQ